MKQLVENLISRGVLKTPLIIEAFLHIDRADFVPSDVRDAAYVDEPLLIGFGQTISQPWTVAFMLELLAPSGGAKILDIGSGSGWQSALLSYIVSHDHLGNELPKEDRGKVIGLEIIPELARQSITNLGRYSFIASGLSEIHCLNARRGYEKEAPYDCLIAAAAGGFISEEWKKQVKKEGRIVAPIDSSIVSIFRTLDDKYEETSYQGFAFVPFVE